MRAITRYQGLLYVGGDFHFTVAYGRTADWMVRYNTTRQSWAIAPAGILDGQVCTFVPFTAPVYPCDSIANCLFTNPNTTAFSSILLDESGAYQWVYSYLDLNTATAFIPTNAAFSTIASDGTVNGYDLNTVLSYHMVWKSYVAGAVGYTTFFETLLTDSRYVSGSPGGLPNQNVGMNKSSDGSLTVFGGGLVDAKVLVPNLASTNGYYNIVDRFFTIPDTLPVMLARYGLTEFSAALTQSGLMANITALKLVTVMAPTNAAFASSYPAWRTIPNARLLEMLKAHIVPNTVWYMAPGKVWNGVSMPTLLGSVLYIGNENRQYNYFDGTVGTTTTSVKSNLFLRNGALHIVDKALARATSVVYTTAITPNSSVPVAQLDNDDISISKDCTVQRSGTVYGGWTVSYNGNKVNYKCWVLKAGIGVGGAVAGQRTCTELGPSAGRHAQRELTLRAWSPAACLRSILDHLDVLCDARRHERQHDADRLRLGHGGDRRHLLGARLDQGLFGLLQRRRLAQHGRRPQERHGIARGPGRLLELWQQRHLCQALSRAHVQQPAGRRLQVFCRVRIAPHHHDQRLLHGQGHHRRRGQWRQVLPAQRLRPNHAVLPGRRPGQRHGRNQVLSHLLPLVKHEILLRTILHMLHAQPHLYHLYFFTSIPADMHTLYVRALCTKFISYKSHVNTGRCAINRTARSIEGRVLT